MMIEGDLDQPQVSSVTVLLPYGSWISPLLSQSVSIGGSYCTVSPNTTHTEVSLSQADNQIFRSIRLSLKLSPIASLWLLEDGLTRVRLSPAGSQPVRPGKGTQKSECMSTSPWMTTDHPPSSPLGLRACSLPVGGNYQSLSPSG